MNRMIRTRSTITAAAIAATVAALALSACGSSGGGGTPSQTSSTTSTTTASTTPSTTAATTTTTTTATAPTATIAGSRACVASRLTVSFLGQQGATGHGLLGFSVRNRGSARCHTFGYPGVLFLDRAGRPLPTNSVRTTHDFFGEAPEVRIVLAPRARASFRLGVTHGAASTAHCATAYGLQVIPPDDTAMLRVRIPGGAYECRTTTVSPLRPGRSAYP
jgi:hypothetical protein